MRDACGTMINGLLNGWSYVVFGLLNTLYEKADQGKSFHSLPSSKIASYISDMFPMPYSRGCSASLDDEYMHHYLQGYVQRIVVMYV